MKTLRILALCGSLRAASSNKSLLQAAQRLAPDNIDIQFYDGLAGLPHFNPDLDGDAPAASVLDLRRQVGSADGLLVSTPEYARGVPGSLKTRWTGS